MRVENPQQYGREPSMSASQTPGWGQPQQPGYSQQEPPKKAGLGKKIAKVIGGVGCLGVVVIIAVAVIAGGSSSDSGGSKAGSGSTAPKAGTSVKGGNSAVSSGGHPADDDVKITSCELDSFGMVTAKVTIVNHSSKASDYLGSIYFMSGQTRTGSGAILESNVKPNQKVLTTAVGTSDAQGKITCVVGDDLSRTASLN